MKFDFYYSEESEQYSFYSVPKMFFTLERFTGLSAMSKLLYGFLLDRMSLSRKRNWIDDKNRAYIKYSLNAITKDMGVSKNSVIKYMRELQEFGLIMKFQIEGMEDIIYVMDFQELSRRIIHIVITKAAIMGMCYIWITRQPRMNIKQIQDRHVMPRQTLMQQLS